MKITVEQRELMNSMKVAKGIINSKSTVEILQCVYFKASENLLEIIATNVETTTKIIIPAIIEEEGEVVVKFDILFDYIGQLPNEKISIYTEDNKLVIKCKNSIFEIVTHDKDLFPKIKEIDEEKENANISILAEDLIKLIKETIYAASKDDIRPILQGINIKTLNSNICAYGCDGYRLSKSILNVDTNINFDITVPTKVLANIIKNLDDEDEVKIMIIGDNKLMIIIEKIKYITNLMDGKYIDVEQILKVNNHNNIAVKIKREEMLSVLNRIEIIRSTSDKAPLYITIAQEKIELFIKSDKGKIKEEIIPEKIISSVDTFKIAMNPIYLREALQNIDTEEIIIKFKSNIEPIIIEKADRSDYIGLILPIRVEE